MSGGDPSDPLCVTFQLTRAEYAAGVRSIATSLLQIRLMLGVTVLGLAGILVGTALSYWPLWGTAAVVTGIYVVALLWAIYVRPGRQYDRRPEFRGEQNYCFSDSQVSWTFVSGGSHVKWSYFVDLLESKDMFVLRHPMKRMGQLVPKRAFTSPDAEARFRLLAAQIGARSGRITAS